MKNVRGAGRKSKISDEELRLILNKIDLGESVSDLANQFGISKQALYKKIQAQNKTHILNLDYIVEGKIISKIKVDFKEEEIAIENVNQCLATRPFGYNNVPDWNDFLDLVFSEYLIYLGIINDKDRKTFFLSLDGPTYIDLKKILDDKKCHLCVGEYERLEIFNPNNRLSKTSLRASLYNKKLPKIKLPDRSRELNLAYVNGYHIKGVTRDRLNIIKMQATILGTVMRDYLVEMIAANLCLQLGINHVEPRECNLVFENKVFNAICVDNFEARGCSMVSLRQLVDNIGYSYEGFDFFDPVNKIKWCADKLSIAGNIPYEESLKYIVDIVLVDCLVGNVDRTFDNIYLLYNVIEGKYSLAPLSNFGQGLFENDGYRDTYLSYSSAILPVYIKPYDETPFDMLDILHEEFDLVKTYPALKNIEYTKVEPGDIKNNSSNHISKYAHIYIEKIKQHISSIFER